MQKIGLLCVGKASGFYADGVREYEKRLRPYCRFTAVELAEEPLREKHASAALVQAALEKEGKKLLEALPAKGVVLALCVEGKQMDSEQFAALLSQYAVQGESSVHFVIGSSHGLSPLVKSRADRLFSLSKMTLPHQLARLVLTEQIYRAFQIGTGGKYHK